MDLPLAADALPDHHVPAAIDRCALLVPAHVGADLDRRFALDIEVFGLELERVPRPAGELEQRFDGQATANRALACSQDLRILGIAGGDACRVAGGEKLQELPTGLGDARACVRLCGDGYRIHRAAPTFSLR